jgi:hypothetical protein
MARVVVAVVNDISSVVDKLFEHTFEGTDNYLHLDSYLSCLSRIQGKNVQLSVELNTMKHH